MREKLIALIDNAHRVFTGWGQSIALADHLLANGVVVREKGEWTVDGLCSVCGCDIPVMEDNFCPNCGADMRGAVNNG